MIISYKKWAKLNISLNEIVPKGSKLPNEVLFSSWLLRIVSLGEGNKITAGPNPKTSGGFTFSGIFLATISSSVPILHP